MGRVTFSRESSGQKSSAAGERSSGRIGTGGRATTRAVAARTPDLRAETMGPDGSRCWECWRSRLTALLRKAMETGWPAGIGPWLSSRRRGDGTCGRSADPKQGRSRRQPRPDRRAKATCITNELGKSGGAGETGGSGRSSGDEGDTITLSEQRARGPRWLLERARGGLVENASRVTQGGALATKTTSNRDATEGMRIWRFTLGTSGKGVVDSDTSA
jgi:hypothetical protein